MPLFITESEVEQLLSVPLCIGALHASFANQAERSVINHPRRRLLLPGGTFHFMEAADLGLGRAAIKTYASYPPKTRFLVLLYDTATGDLLAIIEADRLGQLRTGAATGLATQLLSNDDASALAVFGSGWQAETQVLAIATVRKLTEIRVFSRSEEKRAAFASKMETALNTKCVAVESPAAALKGAHIIVTATTSRAPVFDGKDLEYGTHVNAVGSNMLSRAEIDITTVTRAKKIVVDSIEQAKMEAGDLLPAVDARKLRWEEVFELHQIVSGATIGRTGDEEITLFKSIGVALEDVAAASLVFDRAVEAGLGRQMEMWAQN